MISAELRPELCRYPHSWGVRIISTLGFTPMLRSHAIKLGAFAGANIARLAASRIYAIDFIPSTKPGLPKCQFSSSSNASALSPANSVKLTESSTSAISRISANSGLSPLTLIAKNLPSRPLILEYRAFHKSRFASGSKPASSKITISAPTACPVLLSAARKLMLRLPSARIAPGYGVFRNSNGSPPAARLIASIWK